MAALTAAAGPAADNGAWEVIGRQGIVQRVLAPPNLATDRPADDRQIERLCKPGQTCFIDFKTLQQRDHDLPPLDQAGRRDGPLELPDEDAR